MYPGAFALDSAGIAPAGLSLGFAGSPEVWELLVLIPSFLLRAQWFGQCQQPGLLLGWLMSLT